MIKLISPKEYFLELIELSAPKEDFDIKIYLSELMVGHISSDSLLVENLEGKKEFPTLVNLLAKAIEDNSSERYKKMGDTSLYISGYFSESLNKKLVDIDYYIKMGQMAYAQVYALNPNLGIYNKLSERFDRLVDLLGQVSDFEPKKESDILRLCEVYSITQSPRILKKLNKLGIFPSIQKKSLQ